MIKHKYIKISLIICFSVLIITLLIIGLFKLIELSRLENKDYKPKLQANTIWKCTDPDIEFEVNNYKCFGKVRINSEIINLQIVFGPGMSKRIKVKDIHTDDFAKDKYYSTTIFKGDCKFYESKCIVKVTESNVDNIKVGDKITFVKQEP